MSGTTESRDQLTKGKLARRIVKASIKVAIICLLFYAFSQLVSSLQEFYKFESLSVVFLILVVAFTFANELSQGSVFNPVLKIGYSFIMMIYFALAMHGSTVQFQVESVALMIDLRFFFGLFILFSLLGFARNLLNLIDWINDKDEQWLRRQLETSNTQVI
ncbi:MAG: hypothetical protein JSV35_00120 [Candidatus Bathyarchaeota archaeon]|nr:MAG: hypothetical protein JSV35_00120 [Candidatus Bathyarchaeota archaeon]